MKYSCPFDLSTARLSVPSGAEKSASLAAFFGVGGVGHLASNASGRAGHHGSNLAEVMAHRGFQHGLLEQKINPARQLAMKAMFGPEALADYEVARRAGGAAVQHAPDPVTRDRYLKALYGVIDTEKNLDGAPIIDPLRRALQHEFMGTTPQFAAKGRVANLYGKAVDRLAGHTQTGFETGAQKAVGMLEGAAPAAMFAGADTLLTGSPMGALGHFSVNGAREVGAQLFGERFAQSEIAKGLAGKLPSAGWQKAVDYAVSPALLDARRAGDHLRRSMPPEMAAQSAEHVTNAQHIYDNIKGIKATFHDAKNHEGGINALMGDQIRQIETASENIRGIPDTFKNPAYHDDIINTVAGDYIRKGQDLKNRAGAAVTDARDHFNNWRSSKVPAGSNGVAPQGADPASYFYSPEQGQKKMPVWENHLGTSKVPETPQQASYFHSSEGAARRAPEWKNHMEAAPKAQVPQAPQAQAPQAPAPQAPQAPAPQAPAPQAPAPQAPQAARAPARAQAHSSQNVSGGPSRLWGAAGGAAIGGLGGGAYDQENRPRGTMLGAAAGAGAGAAGAHFLR